MEILNSNSIEKFKITNIDLNLPSIPNALENLEFTIQTTLIIFNTIYNNFVTYVNELGFTFNKETFVQNTKNLFKVFLNSPQHAISDGEKHTEQVPIAISEDITKLVETQSQNEGW
jgi:hypothetical protein